MNLEDLTKDFLLADWHYEFSDDYGVYNRGRAQVEKITKQFKDINWTTELVDEFIKKVTYTINEWYPSVDNTKYIESNIVRIKKMVGN